MHLLFQELNFFASSILFSPLSIDHSPMILKHPVSYFLCLTLFFLFPTSYFLLSSILFSPLSIDHSPLTLKHPVSYFLCLTLFFLLPTSYFLLSSILFSPLSIDHSPLTLKHPVSSFQPLDLSLINNSFGFPHASFNCFGLHQLYIDHYAQNRFYLFFDLSA